MLFSLPVKFRIFLVWQCACWSIAVESQVLRELMFWSEIILAASIAYRPPLPPWKIVHRIIGCDILMITLYHHSTLWGVEGLCCKYCYEGCSLGAQIVRILDWLEFETWEFHVPIPVRYCPAYVTSLWDFQIRFFFFSQIWTGSRLGCNDPCMSSLVGCVYSEIIQKIGSSFIRTKVIPASKMKEYKEE